MSAKHQRVVLKAGSSYVWLEENRAHIWLQFETLFGHWVHVGSSLRVSDLRGRLLSIEEVGDLVLRCGDPVLLEQEELAAAGAERDAGKAAEV